MPTYKGYHKKATSDKMMRIIKRERILSMIIAGQQSGSARLYRTNPTPEGKRRADMSWHEANLTTLQIVHHASQKDIFDYKMRLIDETGWLKHSKKGIIKKGEYFYAEFQDTRKLRIFYDWLHHAKEFSIRKVLKYMYSPLFIAMFYMDQSNFRSANFIIDLPHTKETTMLKQWFNDILQLHPTIVHFIGTNYYAEFNEDDKEKLIALMKEYLLEFPERFTHFYEQEVSDKSDK